MLPFYKKHVACRIIREGGEGMIRSRSLSNKIDLNRALIQIEENCTLTVTERNDNFEGEALFFENRLR